jgi:hypothetical protein
MISKKLPDGGPSPCLIPSEDGHESCESVNKRPAHSSRRTIDKNQSDLANITWNSPALMLIELVEISSTGLGNQAQLQPT